MDPTPHDEALSKAKIGLMSKPDSAFFTTLAFGLRHRFNDRIPTARTDGRTVEYSPAFFLRLDPEERIFLLLHEAMHCAYLHMDRVQQRDPIRFNVACDHVINLQLLERGFRMPAGGLADPQYRGLSAEAVYDRLPPVPDDTALGVIGADLQAPDAASDALQQEIHDILVRASLQSRIAGDAPGTVPGDIEIVLDRLRAPKLPWQRLLQRYLHAFNRNDYTLRRPNRRFFPRHHLPSLSREGLGELVVAVDTSGSVTDDAFQRFVSETHALLRGMQPERITVIQFDTAIKSIDVVKNVRDLMGIGFTGRGGTRIEPVLEWADAHRAPLLLVFTDGHFRFRGVPARTHAATHSSMQAPTRTPLRRPMHTLWVIHNHPEFAPPFGRVIHYEI